jgi:hypothetical protein
MRSTYHCQTQTTSPKLSMAELASMRNELRFLIPATMDSNSCSELFGRGLFFQMRAAVLTMISESVRSSFSFASLYVLEFGSLCIPVAGATTVRAWRSIRFLRKPLRPAIVCGISLGPKLPYRPVSASEFARSVRSADVKAFSNDPAMSLNTCSPFL